MDFSELAQACPEILGPHVDARGRVDFRSPAASAAVTRALLLRDYGIAWGPRPGALIPPVPQRRAYLDWVRQLLGLCPPPKSPGDATSSCPVRGLDIGCGASLIFPLLGAAGFGWSWVATESDPGNRIWAKKTAACNPSLAIEIRETKPPGGPGPAPTAEAGGASLLVGVVRPESERFAFSVCNPPFFSDMAEREGGNPSTAHEGTEAEMVYPGGEMGFVQRLFVESAEAPGMRDAVHWYTTMLGKKSSLKQLRAFLQSRPEVAAVRSTEFALGRTHRWGLAWTFSSAARGSDRTPLLPLETGRHSGSSYGLATRPRCTFEFVGKSCDGLWGRIVQSLERGGRWTVSGSASSFDLLVFKGDAPASGPCLPQKRKACGAGEEPSQGRSARVALRSSGPTTRVVTVNSRGGEPLSWMEDFLHDLDELCKT